MTVPDLRRHAHLALLLCVFALPAAAANDTVPVTIHSFVGLPADSSDRRDLLQAFRAALEDDLPCQKYAGDAWTHSGPRRNPFRVVDVVSPGAAWTLDLELGLPAQVRVTLPKSKGKQAPPRPRMSGLRTSRGLIIVVTVVPPSGVVQGESPAPTRFPVYFPAAHRALAPSTKLAGGGYAYPWIDAGRVIALAALESLHRASGGLAADERADLMPAARQGDAP